MARSSSGRAISGHARAGLQGPAARGALRPFHVRSRTRDPDWVYEAGPHVTSIYSVDVLPDARAAAGRCRRPGPVILAPNHFSFMDHFFAGAGIRRKVRFMAKSQLFTRPCSRLLARRRVPRASRLQDEEAFITAAGILERGGRSSCTARAGARAAEALGKPKRGIGRLALSPGDQVVPVAIHGSPGAQLEAGPVPEGLRPVRGSDPWEPVAEPTREQQQEVANEIFTRSGAFTVSWTTASANNEAARPLLGREAACDPLHPARAGAGRLQRGGADRQARRHRGGERAPAVELVGDGAAQRPVQLRGHDHLVAQSARRGVTILPFLVEAPDWAWTIRRRA